MTRISNNDIKDPTAISQLKSDSNPNAPPGGNGDCARAALLGALVKLRQGDGKNENPENAASLIDKLAAQAGLDPNNNHQGTTNDQAEKAAKSQGVPQVTAYNGTANGKKLIKAMNDGGQALITIKNPSGKYHSVRVDHIDEKKNIAWIHDPASKDGKLIEKPLSEIIKSMEQGGNTMLVLKNKKDPLLTRLKEKIFGT